MVLVSEVLHNIRLSHNMFRLCGATKTVVSLYGGTGVYGTQGKHNEQTLTIWHSVLSGGGDAYGVRRSPGGESQLVTCTAGPTKGSPMDPLGLTAGTRLTTGAKTAPFIEGLGHTTHVRSHKDVTTPQA